MISFILLIILILAALFVSFIFSGSETALASIEYEGNIQKYFETEGSTKAKKLLEIWKTKPWRILNAIVIGNNIATIVISIVSVNLARQAANYFDVSATVLAFWFAVCSIVLVFVFCDMLPKILGREHPEKFFLKSVSIILFFEKVIYPINSLFSKQMSWISEVFGFKIIVKSQIRDEEVLEVLDIGKSEGSIDEGEKKVIESILSFEDLTVESVMMPKTKMDCIDIKEPLEDILEKIKKWKHSRIPVYENEFDNIIGLLYTKDLLILNEHKDLIILKDMLRPVQFVPEAKKVRNLLVEFKKGHYHLAIVIDEYGVVQGMITMEDILEEIVGDILDEYDVFDTNIITYKQRMFLVNGDIELEVLDNELQLDLREDCEDEVRTLSGYIMFISGRIPKKGEIIRHKNLIFWIKDVDGRLIKKIAIKKHEQNKCGILTHKQYYSKNTKFQKQIFP